MWICVPQGQIKPSDAVYNFEYEARVDGPNMLVGEGFFPLVF